MPSFDGYQQTFEGGVSPFVKWSLSPFLLFFLLVFGSGISEAWQEGRSEGVLSGIAICLACGFGILALWGVPHAGRVVSGSITSMFGWYLITECFIEFDGSWGFGESSSSTTPIKSILGFLVFGLPCLIYTILGRFTLRAPVPDKEFEFDPDLVEWNEESDHDEEEESPHP